MNSPNGDSHGSSTSLLAADEQGPAIAVNKGATSPFLLVGDHSGRIIPASLENLGLSETELCRHIAWDIGVHALGLALSARLNAAFIAQRYSRLVIDCNRDPERADAIAEISDGTQVPANRDLTPQARQQRIDAVFTPYHAAIAAELDARAAAGLSTLVIALHSFTPNFAGQSRPWHYGVLHMGDSEFSRTVLASLRGRHGEALVGDNAPYTMDGTDFTVPHHCHPRGLDYLELEVRQDLLSGPAAVEAIADDLLAALSRSP